MADRVPAEPAPCRVEGQPADSGRLEVERREEAGVNRNLVGVGPGHAAQPPEMASSRSTESAAPAWLASWAGSSCSPLRKTLLVARTLPSRSNRTFLSCWYSPVSLCSAASTVGASTLMTR